MSYRAIIWQVHSLDIQYNYITWLLKQKYHNSFHMLVFLFFFLLRFRHPFAIYLVISIKRSHIYIDIFVFCKCSAECGEGRQHRNVTCHRVNRYGWIDPTATEGCLMDQRPISEQICKLRECNDEYHWTSGAWRKVSAIL